MSVHTTPTRRAIRAPLALLIGFGVLTLGGCDDWELPTGPGQDRIGAAHAVFSVATGTESAITSDDYYQDGPAISGNRIVWTDYRNGAGDIYLYDLSTSTETRITTDVNGQYSPRIDGTRIAWLDGRHSWTGDIYVYDISTGVATRLTAASSTERYDLRFSGDRVVWRNRDTGDNDIYMYDLSSSTETRVTTNTADQTSPDISGDRIVWSDHRNATFAGETDIYMYDLSTSTESRITTNAERQYYPAISGDRIVWLDYRDDRFDGDIYMYDISTKTESRITTDAAKPNQRALAISGDWIVWLDSRNGEDYPDLYLYDLSTGTETRITTYTSSKSDPDVSGDRIVWLDRRDAAVAGEADIYLFDAGGTAATGPVVNTLEDHDDGSCTEADCTFREALTYAAAGDEITFSVTGTITRSSTLPVFPHTNKNLTISGPGADRLTVDGNGTFGVLYIGDGVRVSISGLTITGSGSYSGIANNGDLTLTDCVITGNYAGTSQGGGINNSGTLEVVSSTISNNTSVFGAGIYSTGAGTVRLINSTVSNNLHPSGGKGYGIANSGSMVITHGTITGNSYGVVALPGSAVRIEGSIVWGNSSDVYSYAPGLVTSLGYNLVGTTTDATFAATGDQTGVADAGLATLLELNSPGTTPTHALESGSPAIDAIPTGSCSVTEDQRGVSRPQGSACDIGAYELKAASASDQLDISKTASTFVTREYAWEISKGPGHDYRGFAGDSWDHLYEIEVRQNTESYTDGGWSVSGTITIENNTAAAATIEGVTDVVSGDIAATVDCGVNFPYTLSARTTLSCSYSADLPNADSRTNTATVTTSGDVAGGTATATVDFAEAGVINGNPVVNVTDDNATPDDLTDDRESGELGSGGGFEYSLSFQCPAVESGEYAAGVYTETRVNTATIDEYPGTSDGATVTLTCYAPATAKVVKTTTAGAEDIGQLPFTFGLYAPESSPGQGSPVETVTLNAAGEVSFTTALREEGPWTVAEVLPAGWVSRTDLTCSLVVDYPPLYDASNTSSAGQVLTCSFDNVEKSRVDLLKLTNGRETTSQTWSFALYEGPDGFGGTALASDATPPTMLDFGPVDLDPAGTYTLCELQVPASYSTFWQIDTDGDGTGDVTALPYNPNADDPEPEDLGNRCIDIGAGTGIALSPGTTLHFVVDNAQPGGAPRSNGYWKNWNDCTGGGQADAAEANGGWEEGFWLLEDVLDPSVGGGVTWDDILTDDLNVPITSCPVAVDILDKRKIGKPGEVADGKKQANDPLFNLAAHLLAAQLNLGAGVCTTPDVQGWALEAETLLDKYDFDGNDHDSLGKKSDDGARANELAALLDSYNTGMICGNGGD